MCAQMRFLGLLTLFVFSVEAADSGRLTVDRIFNSKEFTARSHTVRWLPGKQGYTRVIPLKTGGADIVRYSVESKTGEVLVSAAELTPQGSSTPLKIEGAVSDV